MSSEIKFLTPVEPTEDPNPNFVNVIGDSTFFNFSQTASGSDNSVDVDSVVKGGVAMIDSVFDNTFVNDPTFASLFIEDFGTGIDGLFQGTSKIESEVVASFDIVANTTFSFDFSADLEQRAKEIENADAEYNLANSNVGFLVMDNSNHTPKVIDYFGIKGKLITSDPTGSLKLGNSEGVTIIDDFKETDINGDNGEDFLLRNVLGTYERKFEETKNITVVKINESEIQFQGDTLIGKLGEDVIYGSIGKDRLKGTRSSDKIYASLGNDKLIGRSGDDILEGGRGDDTLKGGRGQDKAFGGVGNDKLKGNRDDDKLFGGEGNDTLIGGQGQDQMFGDGGNDLLYGGKGDNTMTGGAGNDIFVLSTAGTSHIVDYQDGQDLLSLTGELTFDSLYIFEQNNGTFINTSNNQPLAFLANVNPNSITVADFMTETCI